MDSSAKSDRGKPSKPPSDENGGRTSSQRLPRNVQLDITSASSSCDSQPCDLDGYRGDTGSSTRLEMDQFMKTQNSAATSFHSSSDKYWEDYFRVMLSEDANTQAGVLVLRVNSDTSSSITSSSSTEQASMVSDMTQESLIRPASPAQSPPPLQGMVRSGGYDPRRIPSSVFERSKCQAPEPVEWSITSTESLFSIHLGNISFLKEQFLPLKGDPQKPEELGMVDGAITMRPPLQDEKASDYPISRQERSSHEQEEEASDGPISQLERNSHENEIAAGVVNAVKIKQGNGCGIIEEKTGDLIVTYMPSLKNSRYDQSSTLPLNKNRLCSCFRPKTVFPWMRTLCCCSPACCSWGWSQFPWMRTFCCCSSACCCWGWQSCQCKCPSLDCNCACPIWPSCDRGCCRALSCCDINCCTCGCYTLSFSWKSCCHHCYSSRKCRHCC